MLNKKREQKSKNQLRFIFRIQRIFLLIPLLILCLNFSILTQAKGTWDPNLQMWLDTTRIAKGLSHQKQSYPMAGIHALHGIAAIFLRTSVEPMA